MSTTECNAFVSLQSQGSSAMSAQKKTHNQVPTSLMALTVVQCISDSGPPGSRAEESTQWHLSMGEGDMLPYSSFLKHCAKQGLPACWSFNSSLLLVQTFQPTHL